MPDSPHSTRPAVAGVGQQPRAAVMPGCTENDPIRAREPHQALQHGLGKHPGMTDEGPGGSDARRRAQGGAHPSALPARGLRGDNPAGYGLGGAQARVKEALAKGDYRSALTMFRESPESMPERTHLPDPCDITGKIARADVCDRQTLA